MLPRTLALSVMQIEQTALVFFAAYLPQGSLTMLYIAQQLTNLPVRLFGLPIGQASLPFFTKEYAKRNLTKLSQMLINSLLEIIYLTLPASIIILILRIPLVRLAYGAGSFPWKATLITGKIVAILALAIFAKAIVHLTIRVFYALHNTKIPLLVALLATFINISLATYFVFFLHASVISLAVALSLSALVEAFLLTWLLLRFLQFQLNPTFYTNLFKIFLASFILIASLWIPFRLFDQFIFDTTHTLPLILLTFITSIIGFCFYLLLSFWLKIDQLQVFLKLFHRLGNWQATLAKTSESLDQSETTV